MLPFVLSTTTKCYIGPTLTVGIFPHARPRCPTSKVLNLASYLSFFKVDFILHIVSIKISTFYLDLNIYSQK